jgi:cytochrome c
MNGSMSGKPEVDKNDMNSMLSYFNSIDQSGRGYISLEKTN